MSAARKLWLRAKLNAHAGSLISRGLEHQDFDSYGVDWYGHDGIDMREEAQRELLSSWTAHVELFHMLRADPSINLARRDPKVVRNDFFPTPDAEIYAAIIATVRPAAIIEVGGGFSTRVARKVVDHLGMPTNIVVIDPDPATDIGAAAHLVRAHIEDVAVESLPLEPPMILFIDSSHVVRAGGDIPHLFNRLIPKLPDGSLVHVHDVFIPYDYPPVYRARFYTEQYVLHALLQGADEYEVVMAGRFMGSRHPSELAAVFGSTWRAQEGGASFWFRVHRRDRAEAREIGAFRTGSLASR